MARKTTTSTARDIDTYQYGKDDNRITVTYKEIVKHPLDQKALKAEMPDIAAKYTTEKSEMRFTMHHRHTYYYVL